MGFQKPGCYPHIKLLTFCLLSQEFQILSTNCRLLGAFSHSEPAEEEKKTTKNPKHITIFKALLNNLQPCIQLRRPKADVQHIQPLEVNAD